MKRTLLAALLLPLLWAGAADRVQTGASVPLRFAVSADPKSLDPLMVTEDIGQKVRYLTAGTLIRINRQTQRPEPALAVSWKIQEGGKRVVLDLRPGVKFSDGTTFDAHDVVYTVRRATDAQTAAPAGEWLRTPGGAARAELLGALRVALLLPSPVAGIELALDSLPILSSRTPGMAKSGAPAAVLGPYVVSEYKPASHLLLRRNPNFWKRDRAGHSLPYLDEIRIDIQTNRELELVRFERGELDLMEGLSPDSFDKLSRSQPAAAKNLGPSLDFEMLWFNLAGSAPIAPYKKAWFHSQAFRRAVSEAIQRQDLARLAYRGLAHPAATSISPSNAYWSNSRLAPHAHNPASALARLAKDGFRQEGKLLRDRAGHVVEFSIITNGSSKTRVRMASLIQQDLAKIGIQVNIVTLDFPSLVERISRTSDYEACLLGLVNVGADPDSQSNLWLSSSAHHAWNPGQAKPSTPWEAEIDRLIRLQTGTSDRARRKAALDRLQEIAWEQAPVLFLVHPDALAAISPAIRNAAPVAQTPRILWNVEWLQVSR